ncbi:hypothetical protein QE152_g39204 [Popillia japonica]|uniref:Uncharacterized protein n=1 Tax=Popillia japonica TaxID=7064 RepID=A0AAW1HUR9_POPJA
MQNTENKPTLAAGEKRKRVIWYARDLFCPPAPRIVEGYTTLPHNGPPRGNSFRIFSPPSLVATATAAVSPVETFTMVLRAVTVFVSFPHHLLSLLLPPPFPRWKLSDLL